MVATRNSPDFEAFEGLDVLNGSHMGVQWQAELSRRRFRRNLRTVLLSTTGAAQPMRLAELQHLAPRIH